MPVEIDSGVTQTVVSFEPDVNGGNRAVAIGYIDGPHLFIRNGGRIEPFGAGLYTIAASLKQLSDDVRATVTHEQ